MLRASLLFDVPVSAIVLRRRRLVLECAGLRPIRHEHQLLHRIRVRSLARSRCSHPESRQTNSYYFSLYFHFLLILRNNFSSSHSLKFMSKHNISTICRHSTRMVSFSYNNNNHCLLNYRDINGLFFIVCV